MLGLSCLAKHRLLKRERRRQGSYHQLDTFRSILDRGAESFRFCYGVKHDDVKPLWLRRQLGPTYAATSSANENTRPVRSGPPAPSESTPNRSHSPLSL